MIHSLKAILLSLILISASPRTAESLGIDQGISHDFISIIFMTDWFTTEEIIAFRNGYNDLTPPVTVPGEVVPSGLLSTADDYDGEDPCTLSRVMTYPELVSNFDGEVPPYAFRYTYRKAGFATFAHRFLYFGPLQWIFASGEYIPNPVGDGVIDEVNNVFRPEAVAAALAVDPERFAYDADVLAGREVRILEEIQCDGYNRLELEIR